MINRLVLGVTISAAAALLGGCPVYPDSNNYRVCTPDTCFDCPDTSYSNACVPWACSADRDCGNGLVCGVAGTCVSGATAPYSDSSAAATCLRAADCPTGSVCGANNVCQVGDCGGSVGCAGGLVCRLEGGRAQCVTADAGSYTDSSLLTAADATVEATLADASAVTADTTAPSVDAPSDAYAFQKEATTSPNDSGDSGETGPQAGGACNSDGECGGGGAKCVDGQCTLSSQLCSDVTQCAVASNEACVDGVCRPTCTASSPCPTGFACDFTRGVCSVNPAPCSSTSQCQGGTVCVETHCLAPCVTATDSAPACPSAHLCVNGGCLPDEQAIFACLNDGVPGSLANACAPSDICLHGDCYRSCVFDGGSCQPGAECKQVTIQKGTFAVCAAPSTLGSECDLAVGRPCKAGSLCINGSCL